MSAAAAPWSVKGIDPKAREIAKDLARRQGLTLGDWLNRMIEDSVGPGEGPETAQFATEELDLLRQALDRLDSRVESAERRSTLAISGIDQTVLGLLSRLETTEREQAQVAAHIEGELQDIKQSQAGSDERLARAEEAAAQPRSIEALRALEAALGKVASHLYDSETRTRETLFQMREDLTGLTGQVGRIEQSDAAPSQVAIDGAVSRIVQRLEEAEARTSGAVRGLETTVQDMEQRLKAAEARTDAPDLRLEQLAQELSRNFETTREELSEKIAQTAGTRIEAMERSLREVSGVVAAAEQRSTRAMDRMGHEVLRVAETLGKRMEGVESRSAQAIQQVGGDVARLADVMENRLQRTDNAQADSLERLGTEIARITERLAERIRQSEERTARLLEEAREKIDQRLASTEKRLSEAAVPAPPPVASAVSEFGSIFAEPDLPPGPFDEPAEPSIFARRGGGPAGFVPPIESLPTEPERSPFEADDFDAASMFRSFDEEATAPGPEVVPDPDDELEAVHEDEEDFAPQVLPEPDTFETPAKLSTRELIEQARAAARSASEGEGQRRKRGLFAGRGKRERKSGILGKAVMASAAAAAISVTTAGLILYRAQSVDHPLAHQAGDQAPALTAGAALTAPQAAVALAPHLTQPTQTTTPSATTAAAIDLAALYADAVRRIEGRDLAGLADLRKDANLGYGPAQFYLAKLYETGDAGLTKDVASARLWTQRAADNGERKAMHNLGLYYFEGTGGAKNLTVAAQWFRKAADLGLVDSQYNLARLYEGGFGVTQSQSEAYKWYLIAARSGDAESRAAADRLKPQLSEQATHAAATAAGAFHPLAPAAKVMTASK